MDAPTIFFTTFAVLISLFFAWTFTKPGEKWLRDL